MFFYYGYEFIECTILSDIKNFDFIFLSGWDNIQKIPHSRSILTDRFMKILDTEKNYDYAIISLPIQTVTFVTDLSTYQFI